MVRQSDELKNTGYEIFIGMLSILSILNLALIYLAPGDGSLQEILRIMNALLSIVFMIDFLYRLFTTESKTGYVFRQFGWADFLASLPVEQLKILRLFRLFRVYRLFSEVGVKKLSDSLIKDRAGSALWSLLLSGIMVLEFGSLVVLRVEEFAPGANIKTASDAIWYTLVTISTVGYGDQFPVTNLGRIAGAVIIVVGVGIFGTFTGYLANLFLSPSKKQPAEQTALADPQVRLEQLKVLMAQQQTAIDDIECLLSEQDA